MAHVTDYDVWHETEEPVTVEMVIRILLQNTKLAQDGISYLVEHMADWEGDYPAHQGLRDALITDRSKITAEVKKALAPLVGKYLD